MFTPKGTQNVGVTDSVSLPKVPPEQTSLHCLLL